MSQADLIIVSNRLPVSVRETDDGPIATPSAGGLATALSGVSKGDGVRWVGWPGAAITEAAARHEVDELLARQNLVPVHLTAREVDLYYHGFSNAVLWPIFHYFTTVMDYADEPWRAYVDVNRKFAMAVAAQAAPGATVWLHDFHLMLVPGKLRELRPDLKIGFFLHIPFPSSEVYRIVPCRSELLYGLLGANYISFHTHDYARHFRSACLRILGLESEPTHVLFEGRHVEVGVDPIGIDTEGFARSLDTDAAVAAYGELRDRYAGRTLVLGVERLDYTKGVLSKLRAFERFLERDPSRAKDVVLLQIIVPSRLEHRDYQELKREIEEEVGRINGVFGSPGLTPIEYWHRSVPVEELVALYRYADVGLVTPLRDGMNLVAQEYVLCQVSESQHLPKGQGILVLSEFAGATHCLTQALLVNPFDMDQTSQALCAALELPRVKRRERMEIMAASVVAMDCQRWAERFLDRLRRAASYSESARAVRLAGEPREALRESFVAADQRLLLLDYDGTLRELAKRPQDAPPTDEILRLLRELASLRDTSVHIVSGRLKVDLEEWFGDLPIYLCAEHGAIWRSPGAEWQPRVGVDVSWMDHVRQILREVTRDVAGTFIEEKSCGLTWHYRLADVDYGPWRARELMSLLESYLANQGAEVICGNRVVEVRATGVSKGAYVADVLRRYDSTPRIVAIGDDRTDLDLYQALPSGAFAIHVGRSVEEALYMLESPVQVRELLFTLAADVRAGQVV